LLLYHFTGIMVKRAFYLIDMTLKQVVFQAVQQLLEEGKTEFSADQICQKGLEIDPSKKRRSILGTISGLTKGGSHQFYTEKDQFLERIKYNLYKYSPAPTHYPETNQKSAQNSVVESK